MRANDPMRAFRRTLSLAFVLLAGCGVLPASAQGVGIQITLTPEAAAQIRAWRRAQGLDAPEPIPEPASPATSRVKAPAPPPRLKNLRPRAARPRWEGRQLEAEGVDR